MNNSDLGENKGRADHIDHLVSKRLKIRRLLLGLSQQELSEAVDVSVQQVQKYEKAINRISSGRLYGFSKILQVPVNYFFEQNNESIGSFSEDSAEYSQDNESNTPSEKEIISLVKSFAEIKNPQVRKKILELLKAMA